MNILFHKKWQKALNLIKQSAIYQYILFIFIFEYYCMELINFMEQNHSGAANNGSAIQKFRPFYETRDPLTCSQASTCVPYPKRYESSPYSHTPYIFRIRFNTDLRLVPSCSR
jgi:hypothetical protein